MSRSYKKHPHIKDCGDTDYKKIYNRKIRRSNAEKFQDIPNGKSYKKLLNPWEIADINYDLSWESFLSWPCNAGLSEDELRGQWKKWISK